MYTGVMYVINLVCLSPINLFFIMGCRVLIKKLEG